jgi:hypothetical protein
MIYETGKGILNLRAITEDRQSVSLVVSIFYHIFIYFQMAVSDITNELIMPANEFKATYVSDIS